MATRTRATKSPDQPELVPSVPDPGLAALGKSPLQQAQEVLEQDEAAEAAELEGEISDDVLDELEQAGDLPADDAPIANVPAPPRRDVDPVLEHATPRLLSNIAKAMRVLKRLEKREKNEQGGYRYASSDAFFEACQDVLADHDLILLTDEAATGVSAYQTKGGAVGLLDSTWRFLLCSTIEQDVYIGPFLRRAVAPSSMGAQAYGAVLSYAIKNYLRGQFLIPTGAAEIDQTHGGSLPPRAREASGQQQQRQAPPGYTPRQDEPRRQAEPIPQRSRQPAGNGAPPAAAAPGPRSAVFKLRARLNQASIDSSRVCKTFGVNALDELTDAQINDAHRDLDDVGVPALATT